MRLVGRLANILYLGIKELYSLARDPVLMGLIVYTFTFAVYTVAKGVKTEVRNASIAFVDEDGSSLSRNLRQVFLRPYFQPPAEISSADVDPAMDAGRFTFVVDIPPGFEADVLAGRQPTLQLNVDATAMTLAGNGSAYVQAILAQELARFVDGTDRPPGSLVELRIRARFNPNLESAWFTALMQIINNVTLLALILSGAAVIREREHGTIEHLLVMPVRPSEIMAAKIWANGLVIVLAAVLSLYLVVEGVLAVPIAGSVALFALGTAVYLFALTSLGILLATIARSMPQFGLLCIPIFVAMNMLSGTMTPLEAMPMILQVIMQVSPSVHYVALAQAVLYRGAGLAIVWPQLLLSGLIGLVFFAVSLARFRSTMSAAR